MMKYNKEDIIRMAEEEDVEFIRLQFTDIFGVLKNMAVTVSQLEKVLDNQCMFDGSSIEGFLHIFIRIWTPLKFFHGVPSREKWPD